MRSLTLAAAAAALALPAQAACYADYKAKQDDPLRLHYGVIELGKQACADRNAAGTEVRARLKPEGWKLLTLISTFDAGGLEARRSDAGQFFLRY